jgi:signal transduction histidine kinase/ActR/RegA family two-component response regulator
MAANADELRVLICAPFGRDAELSTEVLQRAGVACHICKDLEEVVDELHKGAAALLTADEMIAPARSAGLAEFIARQPNWSDLPILVLTKVATDKQWLKEAYERLRNLTLLEIPIRPSTLVSAVRAAVRARGRQYEIAAADRRKDEFLAMLGHELRNPLAPIGAAAQLLDLASSNVVKVKMASEIIARQVRHMTSLIDDLLDVARVTRGLITLDKRQIDLKHVLHEALEQSEPMMRERGHELCCDFPEDEIPVEGDRKRLVQVFANILHNAAKYTPNGGKIRVLLSTDADQASVEVRDNGIGMAPHMVPHVFDLFAQAERSADRSQGGLGLGLSLVKSLAESHGGSVQARSGGLGAGSVFTVTLPLVANAASIQSGTSGYHTSSAATEKLRALVVDDNRDAADTLAMLLEARGYDVAARYSAREALAYAADMSPHVCLLDIGLPDMNGNDVARMLRNMPETSNAILIAVTGYGQPDDREKSRASGFDDHLVKPINVEQLLQLISVMAGSPLRGPLR